MKKTTPTNQIFTTRDVDIGDENAIESLHNIRFNAFGNDRIYIERKFRYRL